MTALPPPSKPAYETLGFWAGFLFGLGSAASLGAAALAFPAIGVLAGKIFGALSD